jgi:hypothetical protein
MQKICFLRSCPNPRNKIENLISTLCHMSEEKVMTIDEFLVDSIPKSLVYAESGPTLTVVPEYYDRQPKHVIHR